MLSALVHDTLAPATPSLLFKPCTRSQVQAVKEPGVLKGLAAVPGLSVCVCGSRVPATS